MMTAMNQEPGQPSRSEDDTGTEGASQAERAAGVPETYDLGDEKRQTNTDGCDESCAVLFVYKTRSET
jgi:hypothetical protein